MRKKVFSSPPLPLKRAGFEENPVKLCHDISRLTRAKVREAQIDGVMSQPGARFVLGFLAANDGVTQRKIVEATHLRPPTVSVIISKMQDEGMVSIEQNPLDKRQTIILLTERGREVDAEVVSKIKETDTLALEGLDADEIETLMRLLSKLKNNMIAATTKERSE